MLPDRVDPAHLIPAIVLSASFRFQNPALVHARMRLYADRLELSGWHLNGRYFRRISLQQILQADVPDEDLLLLWLSNGETLRLQVKAAPQWRDAIDGYLSSGQARCT